MDKNFAKAFKVKLMDEIKEMTKESPKQAALFLVHMAEMTDKINHTLKENGWTLEKYIQNSRKNG
ncbi:hypothetical protein E2K98_24825 [Bacillus salipaludis]|uniref:Uncharacterized protein n=1 Tax=Bacillus salipaludis TaxID=2547811 RepID=A0A4R5VJS7_9BACI|nr:hypothetical protein [Bacillus salipaludis]TDK58143.1 hypothetical protein E2K98_24825 [Bacillus salipaludis]